MYTLIIFYLFYHIFSHITDATRSPIVKHSRNNIAFSCDCRQRSEATVRWITVHFMLKRFQSLQCCQIKSIFIGNAHRYQLMV